MELKYLAPYTDRVSTNELSGELFAIATRGALTRDNLAPLRDFKDSIISSHSVETARGFKNFWWNGNCRSFSVWRWIRMEFAFMFIMCTGPGVKR